MADNGRVMAWTDADPATFPSGQGPQQSRPQYHEKGPNVSLTFVRHGHLQVHVTLGIRLAEKRGARLGLPGSHGPGRSSRHSRVWLRKGKARASAFGIGRLYAIRKVQTTGQHIAGSASACPNIDDRLFGSDLLFGIDVRLGTDERCSVSSGEFSVWFLLPFKKISLSNPLSRWSMRSWESVPGPSLTWAGGFSGSHGPGGDHGGQRLRKDDRPTLRGRWLAYRDASLPIEVDADMQKRPRR